MSSTVPWAAEAARTAAVVVVNPSGHRTRLPLQPLPFNIGRQAGNHLVLRDSRASRSHARIVLEQGEYFVEDLGSRHGVYVNGSRTERRKLENSDRIDFGFTDSYKLIFTLEEAEIQRLMEQIQPQASKTGAANLARLRSLVEVARALQSSLPIEDVLSAVVDAALTVTGAERGFLLLKEGETLDVRIARNRNGSPLAKSDLSVPKHLIHKALNQRRELLSMNFDPLGEDPDLADRSVANLELRSVVCAPLVRVRTGNSEDTCILSCVNETLGLLYMDSRVNDADLSGGGRELLQTLALEASTILENARLLEEERAKHQIEKELQLAREIQASLLPRSLPAAGWFRAAGSSIPSHQVGGDCFDVQPLGENGWMAVVTDVSGKGVGSALLASLLQGAFLLASDSPSGMEEVLCRVNHFLIERSQGEKYATVFYCILNSQGTLRWINAGHCPPLLLRCNGSLETLEATGMPVGMMEIATYQVVETQLRAGDKLIVYSDGVSEAQDREGVFFGVSRMRETIKRHTGGDCSALHDAFMAAVENFTGGEVQNDDITLLVLEYRPG